MRKTEIQVGRTYTDGKGNARLVLAAGPEYKLYGSQMDTDCLRFKVVAKKRGPLVLGQEHNCTRVSFAAWAKAEFVAP